VRVNELAERLQVSFEGDAIRDISGAAPIETAGAADLSFVNSRKAFEAAGTSAAGCLVVPLDFENQDARTILRSPQPRATFAAALALLYPAPPLRPGVHPSAVVAGSASVDPSCEIGPHVAIGEGARIGPDCRIGPGSSIGARVSIGAGSLLHARVTIYADVSIGARAVLHSGCVIGADGFGFVLSGDHYEKFPQVGRVIIEADVEIGANACVDRAALGTTLIRQGTKLDNMVHIGHNCTLGRHVVIAAQTGLSGGVTIGDYAIIGGQVGIGDKARIEPRAVLGSGCGVLTSKIVRAGEPVWGVPARPLKEHLTQLANLSKIPELRKQIAELKRRLDQDTQ
jgi:UDP-3-O-[3-hydroxymyristoyl] glucosamine N-acyltransferase